jgi:hypothetical protein
MSLLSPIRSTCPDHHILLGFISRLTFGEEGPDYVVFSSSLLPRPC